MSIVIEVLGWALVCNITALVLVRLDEVKGIGVFTSGALLCDHKRLIHYTGLVDEIVLLQSVLQAYIGHFTLCTIKCMSRALSVLVECMDLSLILAQPIHAQHIHGWRLQPVCLQGTVSDRANDRL